MAKSFESVAREVIRGIFPYADSIYGTRKEITFEEEFGRVTFDQLQLLSEAFGTKLIDIGGGVYSSGCESCGHGSSHTVEIRIRDATRPD